MQIRISIIAGIALNGLLERGRQPFRVYPPVYRSRGRSPRREMFRFSRSVKDSKIILRKEELSYQIDFYFFFFFLHIREINYSYYSVIIRYFCLCLVLLIHVVHLKIYVLEILSYPRLFYELTYVFVVIDRQYADIFTGSHILPK